jgi:membrane-anchored protein YejM (alkaline phosphatase superfamily)
MGYVVCVEAVAQDKNEQNYDLLATYMDNLETALDTALGTTANFYEYTMSTDIYTVSGIDYWAVIVTVTIRAV